MGTADELQCTAVYKMYTIVHIIVLQRLKYFFEHMRCTAVPFLVYYFFFFVMNCRKQIKCTTVHVIVFCGTHKIVSVAHFNLFLDNISF